MFPLKKEEKQTSLCNELYLWKVHVAVTSLLKLDIQIFLHQGSQFKADSRLINQEK